MSSDQENRSGYIVGLNKINNIATEDSSGELIGTCTLCGKHSDVIEPTEVCNIATDDSETESIIA